MTIEQVRLGQTRPLFLPATLPTTFPKVQTQPTIFVDRDGVINQNRAEHVLRWQDFEFIPGSLQALAQLHRTGYQVIVVTNQAAITRGLITVPELDTIHQRMRETIEAHGGQVKNVFYCHHLPTEGCNCRKPRPGLLLQAAKNYNIDLASSWLVGDHLTDVQAAVAAGSKPLLVLTGRGQSAYDTWLSNQQSGTRTDTADPTANNRLTVKANLLEAVEYILAHERVRV